MTNYSEIFKKVFSDIGQRSAYSQMLIGVSSGWYVVISLRRIT